MIFKILRNEHKMNLWNDLGTGKKTLESSFSLSLAYLQRSKIKVEET